MDKDPNFFQYFVKQTNESLQELKTNVARIDGRLTDLFGLKNQLSRDAQWRAWIISGVFAVLTLGLSIGASYWIGERERSAILNEGLGHHE